MILADSLSLVKVDPQPTYIESSGRWCWPLPKHAHFPGCCIEVVTASREWWEYAPSEAKPHPMAEGVLLRDGRWYWAVVGPADGTLEVLRKVRDRIDDPHINPICPFDDELASAIRIAVAKAEGKS